MEMNTRFVFYPKNPIDEEQFWRETFESINVLNLSSPTGREAGWGRRRNAHTCSETSFTLPVRNCGEPLLAANKAVNTLIYYQTCYKVVPTSLIQS